jgi:gliding motility-associated protein GldL
MKNLVKSKKFKNFMAKLYGWGASVVIVGALFKIQHYPGAGPMLMIGLGTEALIFFFSAFEPPHVEPDWSLVYPELAGLYHNDEELQEIEKANASPIEEIDKMLAEAKIGPDLINSLGVGLRSLTDSTSKLSNISNASVATDEYVQNMKTAASSVSELTQNYKKTSEILVSDLGASEEYVNSVKTAAKSASILADTYIQTNEAIKGDLGATHEYVNSIKNATNSANELALRYKQSADSLTKSAEAIDFSSVDGNAYGEQLNKMSKNLSALNSVYELQLQNSEEQVKRTAQLQEGMGQFVNQLNESIEHTVKYKDEVAMLNKNVAAMNNVYGNMLAAMNVNINK